MFRMVEALANKCSPLKIIIEMGLYLKTWVEYTGGCLGFFFTLSEKLKIFAVSKIPFISIFVGVSVGKCSS